MAVVNLAPLAELPPGAEPTAEAVAAARALDEAFATTGFAVVVNAGVAPETVRGVRAAAAEFFGAPAEHKAEFDKGLGYGHGGYVCKAENGAQLLGNFSRPVDLVESLSLSSTGGASDGFSAAKAGAAEYVAGAGAETPPAMVGPVRAFRAEVDALRALLERATCIALGVPPEELAGVVDSDSNGMRLAYYPAHDRPAEPGQLRYGAHIDSGGITVLNLDPDNAAGLQVDLSDEGTAGDDALREWVDVPFVAEDAFVLNVGALLSRWTNGKWRASIHRVANGDTTRPRLSVVTGALGARADGPAFGCFSSCAGESGAGVEAVRASDFLTERVRLHRPDYVKEADVADVAALSRRIKTLHS